MIFIKQPGHNGQCDLTQTMSQILVTMIFWIMIFKCGLQKHEMTKATILSKP